MNNSIKTFTSDLYANMNEELDQISLNTDNILQRAGESYHAVERAMGKLKEFVLGYTFKNDQEEIIFFKEIKPMFQKELIYYDEVNDLEAFVPPVAPKDVLVYYGFAAGRVDLHFKRYNALYTYYRTRSIENDRKYFLRGSGNDLISPISFWDIDTRFSTPYSFQFAKLQAYEKFSHYIQQRIYNLEHPEAADDSDGQKARWTDPKVNLIEVGYAIHTMGSVNNGNTTLKLIMQVLSRAFNVDLGNFNAVISQIQARKLKEKMHYVSSMLEKSEYRIAHSGENTSEE